MLHCPVDASFQEEPEWAGQSSVALAVAAAGAGAAVFGARLSSATGMLQALKKRYTIPWMPSAASGYQGEKAESSRWHPGTKQYIDVKKVEIQQHARSPLCIDSGFCLMLRAALSETAERSCWQCVYSKCPFLFLAVNARAIYKLWSSYE